jgi:hypothetical protein
MRSIICCIALAYTVLGSPVPHRPTEQSRHQNTSNTDELPVRALYQYPVGTFVENVVVRPNGKLLLTLPCLGELHQLDPFNSTAVPQVIHQFEVNSVFGITEYAEDVYAVNGGNYTDGEPEAGSFGIWSVDLRRGEKNVSVSEIASMPDAQFLNGMTSIPTANGSAALLLVADVSAGVIYGVETETGNYSIAINNSLTQTATHPVLGKSGPNRVHVEDSTLYLTYTGRQIFARMALPPGFANGSGFPVGDDTQTEIFTHAPDSTWFYNDFAIRGSTAYMMTGSGNSIQKVVWQGKGHVRTDVVAGNLNFTLVAGPTGGAFGRRTERGSNTLYVTTSGGLNVPVDGNITVGAQVLQVAIDLRDDI